ncbi:MAG: aminotransferase class I/II-fold pyridoxal phosphate-dependent enzyme [Clostridiales bacterium]|nr:aminotransferase class I/II-fold pyridoxal phosphate-dependent enzyme [Clostridiales bacterium]MDY5513309.1 aminotransferase class I/II-fold pyridoxal phosphate-dependent enzyme [Candidatus Ventricola sp.]
MQYDRIVNPRVASVPPSGIRKFFDIVKQMPEAISLGVGEPDFVTPWSIRDAAIASIEEGQTQYTSNWGLETLREKIAAYLRMRYHVAYSPANEVLVTVGASEGIDLAMRALLCPGDEVLIPDPSYVSYAPCVTFAGGVAVPVVTRAQDCFALTPEALAAAITPRTKALILPYPNNPTGGVMTQEQLKAIARVLRGTDIVVVSDEIYSELVYDGHEHTAFAAVEDMRERTITINGFSKAFAMTGWRVGYIAAPRELLAPMFKIHQYTMLCASIQGQVAADRALGRAFETGFEDVRTMVRSYDRRRRLMVSSLNEMGLPCFEPRGAFYVFPSVAPTGLSSEEFCTRLLESQHVACVPGTAFGVSGEGHIRCSYATSLDNLGKALERIRAFVRGL